MLSDAAPFFYVGSVANLRLNYGLGCNYPSEPALPLVEL